VFRELLPNSFPDDPLTRPDQIGTPSVAAATEGSKFKLVAIEGQVKMQIAKVKWQNSIGFHICHLSFDL
jgi:hypothetical protein